MPTFVGHTKSVDPQSINGYTNILRWAKKQVRQVVEAKSDTKKIELLNERLKELERVIGQKQLLIDFQDRMIELAEQSYPVDSTKNSSSTPFHGPVRKGKRGLEN